MRSEKYAVRLDPGLEMLSRRLAGADTSCVVATVISATGSTYRKPGARMLIEPDGRITGLLSGGCLEHDLREHATAILVTGIARTVTYDMHDDNDLIFGTGSGCEGRMTILLEPARSGSRAALAIEMAAELSVRSSTVALATIHDGHAEEVGTHLWCAGRRTLLPEQLAAACAEAVVSGRSQEFSWAGTSTSGLRTAWIQPVRPLPAVLICGAGPDAEPLAAALRVLHFPVTVADHRATYAKAANFPGAAMVVGAPATLGTRIDLTGFFAAVVMSHHLNSDAEYLRVLALTDIEYIGVLGPRMRRARLLEEVGNAAAGFAERMRGPVGLDIGAVTPEGIALAITAEIYAVAAGCDGGFIERAPHPAAH